MNLKSLLSLAAGLALTALAVFSCKEEETETLYMDGSLTLPFPSYVSPGFSKNYNLDTLTTLNKSGDYTKIGYYFTDHASVKDTLVTNEGVVRHKDFTITAPDTLATLSCYLSGYATGYYSSSAYAHFTVVTDESITGVLHEAGQMTFTDPRDGNLYYIAKNGNLEWLEPNLYWKGAGASFENCEAMSSLYGRFYTWEEALKACPEGWRLPTDTEYVELARMYGAAQGTGAYEDTKGGAGDLMADAYFNDEKMWEYWPEVSLSNKSGFAAIPVGYATKAENTYKFKGVNSYALFWTSDQLGSRAAYRYFYVDKNNLFSGLGSTDSFAISVRCVR